MSGILDKKTRILDAIFTIDGRRQLAEETFNVSYVTFTDAGVSYIPDANTGHEDPTDKLYFEACNLPQDQITFESNDAGKLLPFRKQEIPVSYNLFPPTKTGTPPSIVTGKLINGKLVVYQYRNGRAITTFNISKDIADKDCGINYSDSLGLTGSILLNPATGHAGTPIFSASPPWKATIGTQNGLSAQDFAIKISGSIEGLRSRGGPSVSCYSVDNIAYLDTNDTTLPSLLLEFTGSVNGSYRKSLALRQMADGGSLLIDEIANASFASQLTNILTASINNFVNLQTISTINRLFEDNNFELSNNELNFNVKDLSKNTREAAKAPQSINAIDSLFSDNKVSHLDNFLYLPPIVKTSASELPDKSKLENLEPYLLGDYVSWGDNESRLTNQKLMTELLAYKSKPVVFTRTSRNNNIIGQFFEITSKDVSKLDIVDFGEVAENSQETTSVSKRIFFVGKTYIDDRGTTCFVNMFTLIFSKNSLSAEEYL